MADIDIPSPFFQEDPHWDATRALIKKARRNAAQRRYKEKKQGKPFGQHGGARPGAGRPRKESHTITIKINRIQLAVLTEEGWGKLSDGIERLINKYY